ncbi:MAG: hypothetical protein GXC73_17835 [Chitinophagaceae bacterium]|nr:hypothetical protein [Chitinophagaceae bacterium]
MTAFAEYLLKVMICSGVLTGYYWLALRNKLFHSWNRFYLLAAVATSLLLPFIKISFIPEPQPETLPAYTILQSVTTNDVWFPQQVTAAPERFTKEQISFVLYFLVSAILFITLLVTLFRIKKLITAYEHWKMKDLIFVDTDAKGTPFSFLRYIFWNRQIDFESAEGQQIFKHELIHVKEKHSIDKLFLQLVLIVFWINPFFWIIRKEISMIHEFIADRKSVKDSDASALATMILRTAFPGHTISLSNPFFYSPIKRRLLMLSKLKNPKVGYISRLLLLPLLTILFTAFALKIKEKDVPSTIPRLAKSLTVVIDAGHGLKNGVRHGAIGQNGVTEDEIALAIAKKIEQLNTDKNLNLIFTRSDENFIENKERVRIAEANNADLFISLHASYAPPIYENGKPIENKANGFELYVSKDGSPYLSESKKLGSAIIAEMQSLIAIRQPGIKQRQQGIWTVEAAPCPSVLLECGFISNSNDAAFLNNEKNQEKIAEAVLKGIVNYIQNNSKTLQQQNSKELNSTDTIPEKNSETASIKTTGNADFKGGIKEWNKYVETFLEKHIAALENDPKSVNSSCMLQFTVQKDGTLTDIQVVTNTESELAKISIELLKKSPKWLPAKENGVPVASVQKRSVTYFDKYGRERMKDMTKTSQQKEAGLASIAEKHGLHILNGKTVSKEEMIKFIKDNEEHKNWIISSIDGGGGRTRFGEKGSNGVFELTTTELKPTIAIAAENINILYAGVENPLKIAISDVPENHLEIEASQGTLEKKGNRYVLKNLKTGDVVIKIGYYYKTEQKKTEEVRFRVIPFPDPVITIADSRGGRVAASKIAQSKQIAIDEEWEITNYTIYFTGKGFKEPFFVAANKSAEFNQKILEAIAQCQPGTTIVVDEIAARFKKSGLNAKLNPLAFNLY